MPSMRSATKRVEQSPDAFDEVGDKAEGTGLRSVTKGGERFARKRLADEGRHDPAVTRPHPRSIGVEDADDAGIDTVVPMVRHGDGLGEAFGLVIDTAWTNWIDVSPIVLRLWMDERIAVSLRSRCEEKTSTFGLGEANGLVGAQRSNLEGLDGQLEVING